MMSGRALTTILPHGVACLVLASVVSMALGDDPAEVKLRRNPASTAIGRPAVPRATVGSYYFDGWAGHSSRWQDDPAWTRLNPPTHLTKRMLDLAGEKG